MAGDTHIVETSALFGGLMTLMNRTGKDFVAIGLKDRGATWQAVPWDQADIAVMLCRGDELAHFEPDTDIRPEFGGGVPEPQDGTGVVPPPPHQLGEPE